MSTNDLFKCSKCNKDFEEIMLRDRHSKVCHLQKKKGLQEVAVTKKKKLSASLITDYTDRGNLKPRVTIQNEIFELKNVHLFDGIDVHRSSDDYLASVELKYELSFTRDHILCNNYQSFLSKDIPALDGNLMEDLRFYSYASASKCKSKKEGKRLLDFIKSYSPRYSPPDRWTSVKKRVEKLLERFSVLSQTIPFPQSWNIRDDRIVPIKIICFDILENLAFTLADPKIQSSDIFHLRAYQVPVHTSHLKRGRTQNWASDHLMSSKWALESQKRIDQLYTNNPILIAFIPYEDGVTVDNNGNRSCDTVVGTFGNYSSQARHADFSKFHIGFIPKLEQENLLLNILEKRYGGNKSRANEELKIFKLKIRRDFYRLMFSTIKGIAENGNYSYGTIKLYMF
jgi:hypothetical protein